MSNFFIKSVLAFVMIVMSGVASFTMFEIFGRKETRFDPKKMIQMHKINGWLYLLVFSLVSYFCLDFIASTKVELSNRSAIHTALALSILVMMLLKYFFINVYRQYYSYVKMIGLCMVILTFVMSGISGGYYLVVSSFGGDNSADNIVLYKKGTSQRADNETTEKAAFVTSNDPDSIVRGKNIFDTKCSFCHDAGSEKELVGPGMKGILKHSKLPVSGRPATPENIARQLRQPFNRMPSFEYLPDEEIKDIISYLNTL